MQRNDRPYVGRFAPSPTGPLHFGSLVAATASYLRALANEGQWLLRIEDIDPPREQPGATQHIIDTLDAYGFQWQGDVIYQSASNEKHQAAVQSLLRSADAYACSCSRRELEHEPTGPLGTIYPGYCRSRAASGEVAIRVRTNDTPISVVDRLQGPVQQRLQSESGDFIIQRRDGLIAYQLAVVVDDHLQGITEVVRGIDLLDSTPRQVWLQQLLGYTTPQYLHIPVVVHENGDKLSKLTGATAVQVDNVPATLLRALRVLGLNPPADLLQAEVQNVWSWAAENWQVGKLLGVRSVPNPA